MEKLQLPAAFEQVAIDQLVILIGTYFSFLNVRSLLSRHVGSTQVSQRPHSFASVRGVFHYSLLLQAAISASLTRFHSRTAPKITVLDYLRRIVNFINVEVALQLFPLSSYSSFKRSCLLITLYYIDQICARNSLFILSSLTCHRFIITAITVSSKGLCDTFCTNSHYARVGGISVTELNMLEREFLSMIDWRLMVRFFYLYLPSSSSTISAHGKYFKSIMSILSAPIALVHLLYQALRLPAAPRQTAILRWTAANLDLQHRLKRQPSVDIDLAL